MPLDQPGLNSLGLAKPPAETRVVVAMSGGVDSSVVAAMLAREGYDVVGVTLQLYDHGAALARKGACCAGRDIHDARRVAETMGFPHYVLDYESTFRQAVIDEFADSYLGGATPVPCIRCNERVKFRDLLAVARDLGADCMATGHYIRRFDGPRGPELHRAADPARDQSYFLFSTTPEQLAFLRFPLGGLASKAETRALAAEHGLAVADKPDSQDICFVPNGDYRSVSPATSWTRRVACSDSTRACCATRSGSGAASTSGAWRSRSSSSALMPTGGRSSSGPGPGSCRARSASAR
jgi:tRNA-uridine 2-sulfurtransferase